MPVSSWALEDVETAALNFTLNRAWPSPFRVPPVGSPPISGEYPALLHQSRQDVVRRDPVNRSQPRPSLRKKPRMSETANTLLSSRRSSVLLTARDFWPTPRHTCGTAALHLGQGQTRAEGLDIPPATVERQQGCSPSPCRKKPRARRGRPAEIAAAARPSPRTPSKCATPTPGGDLCMSFTAWTAFRAGQDNQFYAGRLVLGPDKKRTELGLVDDAALSGDRQDPGRH